MMVHSIFQTDTQTKIDQHSMSICIMYMYICDFNVYICICDFNVCIWCISFICVIVLEGLIQSLCNGYEIVPLSSKHIYSLNQFHSNTIIFRHNTLSRCVYYIYLGYSWRNLGVLSPWFCGCLKQFQSLLF